MNEIALNYGKALFAISLDDNDVSSYLEETKLLQNVLKENESFVELLASPFETVENRLSIVDKTLPNVNKNIISFIKILIEHNHIRDIYDAFESFHSLCYEHLGILEGLIYSTEQLSDNVIEAISDKISKKENRKVVLRNKIDSNLIGGIKVVINGHIYDGSIKNKIESIKTKLKNKEEY